MKKGIIFLIVCVFLVLSLCGCAENDGCLMEIYYADKFIGSATHIRGDYVLTTAHIFPEKFKPGDICSAADIDGKTYDLELLYSEEENDLALLKGAFGKGGIDISEKTSSVCRSVTLQGKKTVSLKAVSCDLPDKPDTILEMKGDFPKGTSGAPLITDKGTLNGIICARSLDKKYSYAVSCEEIRSFLDRAKNYCLTEKSSCIV